MTPAAAPVQRMSPSQQDQSATYSILRGPNKAIDRTQLVGSGTVFPASNPQVILQPINVGLIKRYIIGVSGTITNTGSTTITLTDWGLANLFANGGIQYTDLNNYLRVNTSGKHLTFISNAKRKRPYFGTYSSNAVGTVTATNLSQMINVNPASWPVFSAPQTIATGESGNFTAWFELPLSYSNSDLRGAIWANVLTAVQQIQLTFNTAAVTANPNANDFAVYSGAAGSAGNISSVSYTVYQQYLDQLPRGQNGAVILPQLSLSTVYELKTTQFQGMTENQEFQIGYANQRSFISTLLEYNSTGASGGRLYGTDMNYLALLAANATYIWKVPPLLQAAFSRDHLTIDNPAGVYYMPTRENNIASLQYGNIQLVLNPITASAASTANVMWEDFALLNTLQSGPSLASGS